MAGLRYARRAQQVTPSAAPAEHGGLISFGDGHAYPEGLPDIGDVALTAAQGFRAETLQYAPRRGLPALREWIAGYVGTQGIRVTPESVLVVNGAKQGIDLVCKLFVEPGDAIVITRPNYHTALGIFRGWEAEFIEIGLDDEGLAVGELESRLRERARRGAPAPKLVYVVPEFHNPTGVTMSRASREAVLALAEQYGMLVLEDDPYRKVRFGGVPVEPLQALDGSRVVGVGTFSKLLAPGLRIGWVVAPPEVVGKMAALKADGGSCPFTQRMLIEYCRTGGLERHVEKMARVYGEHRDAMVGALAREIPAARLKVPDGGYYLWLSLPDGVDTDRLAAEARRREVEILPGSRFYATPGPKNELRLCYSYASPLEIVEGVRRLAEALRALQR